MTCHTCVRHEYIQDVYVRLNHDGPPWKLRTTPLPRIPESYPRVMEDIFEDSNPDAPTSVPLPDDSAYSTFDMDVALMRYINRHAPPARVRTVKLQCNDKDAWDQIIRNVKHQVCRCGRSTIVVEAGTLSTRPLTDIKADIQPKDTAEYDSDDSSDGAIKRDASAELMYSTNIRRNVPGIDEVYYNVIASVHPIVIDEIQFYAL